MSVGRIRDGIEIIGRLHTMTSRDQIIGVTGSREMLAVLEDIVIHTLVDGKIASIKIIAGGIIHRICNKGICIETTKITGITRDRM